MWGGAAQKENLDQNETKEWQVNWGRIQGALNAMLQTPHVYYVIN